MWRCSSPEQTSAGKCQVLGLNIAAEPHWVQTAGAGAGSSLRAVRHAGAGRAGHRLHLHQLRHRAGQRAQRCLHHCTRAGTRVSEILRVVHALAWAVQLKHFDCSLNMPHDDDAKCREFGPLGRVTYVMSRTLDHHSQPWQWSRCSRSLTI